MSGNETLVFLDFDGVLHPESRPLAEHFVYLPRFENVIREFADVRIVITSSWRYSYTSLQLTAHFSEDIRPRIVGVTPLLPDNVSRTRFKEIELYLHELENPSGAWVAVDDAVLEFPKACRNLVLCHPTLCFDESAADKLRSFLNKKRGSGVIRSALAAGWNNFSSPTSTDCDL